MDYVLLLSVVCLALYAQVVTHSMNTSTSPTTEKLCSISGEKVMSWGSQGNSPGEFSLPSGAAIVDSLIYVSDWMNFRVQVFSLEKNGEFVTEFAVTNGTADTLAKPTGLAIHGTEIYVATSHTIYVFDLATHKFLREFGTKGTKMGQFNGVFALAVTPTAVFVTEALNNRVQVLTHLGKPLYAWGGTGNGKGDFKGPAGIAIGQRPVKTSTGELKEESFVFVADTNNCRVQVFDEQGQYIDSFGSFGEITETKEKMNKPLGVTILNHEIYIADNRNHQIDVYDLYTFQYLSTFSSPSPYALTVTPTTTSPPLLYATSSCDHTVTGYK